MPKVRTFDAKVDGVCETMRMPSEFGHRLLFEAPSPRLSNTLPAFVCLRPWLARFTRRTRRTWRQCRQYSPVTGLLLLLVVVVEADGLAVPRSHSHLRSAAAASAKLGCCPMRAK